VSVEGSKSCVWVVKGRVVAGVPMKLCVFVDISIKELVAFMFWWKQRSREDPDKFPLDRGEGDWFDQFLIYLNLDDKE